MYAAISTRPDISFTVQSLSQFTQNPGPEHWIALKRVFRYLQGTQNLGLVYGGALSWPDQILTAYTDADYGSNPNDRRSISGSTYIIAGAAIGWMSKKQSVICSNLSGDTFLFDEAGVCQMRTDDFNASRDFGTADFWSLVDIPDTRTISFPIRSPSSSSSPL